MNLRHDRRSLRNQGPFVVPEVRATRRTLGRGEGSHLVNGVSVVGTSQVQPEAAVCAARQADHQKFLLPHAPKMTIDDVGG